MYIGVGNDLKTENSCLVQNSGKIPENRLRIPETKIEKFRLLVRHFFDAKNCVSFDQFLFLLSNVVDASSSVRITAKMDIIKVADYFDRPRALRFLGSSPT